MARLVLHPSRERRIHAGHPWIYRADVARLEGEWVPAEAVTVCDAVGRVLGRGFYNPRPQIACRLLTRADEPVDAAFFRRRLERAWRFRHTLGYEGNAGRIVSSEGDGLPGLILDRYADILVLQTLTLGLERHAARLAEAAAALLGARAVYHRVDAAAAAIEGLEGTSGWLVANAEPEVEIQEGPCRFRVAITTGQKTGFYLDQRENRATVAHYAQGREVLDAFSYTGAFGCWALRQGARRVLALETSIDACAKARLHAEANDGEKRFDAREANAFDTLREFERIGRRFDLVILDPPSFTRRKTAVEAAVRGYKEITLRALACLRPGGLLATFSCSHHVSPSLFESTCRAAVEDARRPTRLRGLFSQAQDHPVLLAVPETRYLTGMLLEVLE